MKLSWLSLALAIIFVMAIMDAPKVEAKAIADADADAWADADADAWANADADAWANADADADADAEANPEADPEAFWGVLLSALAPLAVKGAKWLATKVG